MGASAELTGLSQAEPKVSALRTSIPSAVCPLCEGSGEAFMFENFRPCSLCLGEGEVANGVADYIAKMGEAQVNLYRQAERERELRQKAEEAFDLVSPWVAKFAAVVGHYNRMPPRYPGSQFLYDPDPGYNPALSVSNHGQAPLNGPTISDLRFLADAYAQAIEARSAETERLGPQDESVTGIAGAAQDTRKDHP